MVQPLMTACASLMSGLKFSLRAIALRIDAHSWRFAGQMSPPRGWGSKPDRYDWTKAFLIQRGRLRSAQQVMAVVCVSAALGPLAVLYSELEPSAAAVVIGGLAAVFCVGMTVFWLTRWPTRRQSEAAIVLGVLCTWGWSYIQPTAALSALACAPTAVTGAYSAIFHRRQIVLFHSVVAAAVLSAAVV